MVIRTPEGYLAIGASHILIASYSEYLYCRKIRDKYRNGAFIRIDHENRSITFDSRIFEEMSEYVKSIHIHF